MTVNIFNSSIDTLFSSLVAVICVLMLLAPVYKWESRPHKALTKRILIAFFLIPLSLYLLVGTFNTKDQQKNDQLLSVARLSENNSRLRDENHINTPDKHAFAVALELSDIKTRRHEDSQNIFIENKDDSQEDSSQVSPHSDNDNRGF